MHPVTYYRAVIGVGLLSGVMGGIISTYYCLFSGRSLIMGIIEFILVFSFLFPTVTVMLWKRNFRQIQALNPGTLILMDPRGSVHLPKNYGPPIGRTLTLALYFSTGDCPVRQDVVEKQFQNCKKHSRFRQTPIFNKDDPINSFFGKPELRTSVAVERHIVDWSPVETEDELTKELQKIESLPLLENAPEWIIYRIPSKGHCRACLVFKISHCIGDGLRLSIWGESQMTDLQGAPSDWGLGPIKGEDASHWSKKRKPVKMSTLSRVKMNFNNVMRILTASNLKDSVTPLHPVNKIFKGRRVTYRMKPIPLLAFRQLGKLTKSTINDILTTVVASAIRRYCLKIDPSFAAVLEPKCRGVMAMGFPCKKGFTQSSEQLFNKFALVPFEFPIGNMSPKERLITTKKTLFEIKNTITAYVVMLITDVLHRLGCYSLQKEILTDTLSNFTCVFSNVRGPSERSCYLGKEIVHVECSYANYTNQFIFLSYGDFMGGTLTTDASCVKEPEILLDYIHTELKRLADAVRSEEKSYPDIKRNSFQI